MLASTARILEISLAANLDAERAEQRRQQIAEFSPIRRGVSEGLLWLATNHPYSATSVHNRIAGHFGYDYLGNGYEYSVYRSHDTGRVTKIDRDSMNVDDVGKQELAETKDDHYRKLKYYLGPMVLPQEVAIKDHIFGGHEAVQVEQDFVDFDKSDSIFEIWNDEIDSDRIRRLIRKYPAIKSDLEILIEASRYMFEDSEEFPDVNGTENIVATPSGLVFIDNGIVATDNMRGINTIRNQIDSLEQAMEFAA